MRGVGQWFSAAVGAVAVASMAWAGGVQAQSSSQAVASPSSSTSSWNTASHALALGLPAVAAWSSLRERDTEGALQLTYALGTTLASVGVLKSQITARRPDGSGEDSFPSGHTAIAFASARFMQERYPDAVPPALLYGAAGLTAVARVQADKHHWKDTLVGAALGYALASYWTDARPGAPRVLLLPTAKGVMLTWQQPLQ